MKLKGQSMNGQVLFFEVEDLGPYYHDENCIYVHETPVLFTSIESVEAESLRLTISQLKNLLDRLVEWEESDMTSIIHDYKDFLKFEQLKSSESGGEDVRND